LIDPVLGLLSENCPSGSSASLRLAQLMINGLALGSIIALAAVGLTLTYGILRLPNFAHGDLVTLGAYLTLSANLMGLPVPIAIVVGALGSIIFVLITEKLLWQPMRSQRATMTTLIIISIGLALFLRNGILQNIVERQNYSDRQPNHN
jgi:neutral amino acid transport system permease protein